MAVLCLCIKSFLARVPEMLIKERNDFVDAVGPGRRVAAGGGAAPTGGVDIHARGNKVHWPRAVECMVGAGVDLD